MNLFDEPNEYDRAEAAGRKFRENTVSVKVETTRVKPFREPPVPPLIIQQSFVLFQKHVDAMKEVLRELVDFKGPIVFDDRQIDMAVPATQDLLSELRIQKYEVDEWGRKQREYEEAEKRYTRYKNSWSAAPIKPFPMFDYNRRFTVDIQNDVFYISRERIISGSAPAEEVVDRILETKDVLGTRIGGVQVADIIKRADKYGLKAHIITVLRIVVPFVFYAQNEGARTASEWPEATY